MHILFLTDNFPPEINAPASRTYDHCREWVKHGARVTVITCVPNFPQGKVFDGYKNKLIQKEVVDGINIIRVWSYIKANEGVLKRVLDYFSFSVAAFIAGLFLKFDIIIATSPQFFTALAGRALSMWKRKPWIMEVRDIWPESIKVLGAIKNRLIIRFLEWQEMLCYRTAKKVVVVTDSFRRKLIERGVKRDKIVVVKNGVNPDLFYPIPKDESLIKELELDGKFIVGYIGTHGIAHKLDFIFNCAKRLENPDIHFLFIGSGTEKKNLLKMKEDMQLNNITMLDPVPKSEVIRYLSILDIALIQLRKSYLFKTVIPSKIFENAAMQIPLLIGVDGEARKIVEEYNAGIYFEPENSEDFLIKLNKLIQNKDYQKYREGGQLLAKSFNRKKLAKKMLDYIIN